jgi:CBS domain-containing protein
MLERMERVRVADLMGSVPRPLAPALSLREALQVVRERPSLLWPVGDPLRGTLLLAQIDAVPSDRWDTTTVADVAIDPAASSVEVDAAVDDAVEMMARSPENMLVVTDRGRPVGLLTPSLLADWA